MVGISARQQQQLLLQPSCSSPALQSAANSSSYSASSSSSSSGFTFSSSSSSTALAAMQITSSSSTVASAFPTFSHTSSSSNNNNDNNILHPTAEMAPATAAQFVVVVVMPEEEMKPATKKEQDTWEEEEEAVSDNADDVGQQQQQHDQCHSRLLDHHSKSGYKMNIASTFVGDGASAANATKLTKKGGGAVNLHDDGMDAVAAKHAPNTTTTTAMAADGTHFSSRWLCRRSFVVKNQIHHHSCQQNRLLHHRHQMQHFLPSWTFSSSLSSFPLRLIAFAILLVAPSSMMAQSTAKCYSFSPGLTITGADYRRDYGLSRRQCADVCKTDLCCMAFEWRRTGGQCTLKSRSLNGTVVQIPPKELLQEEEDAPPFVVDDVTQLVRQAERKRSNNGDGAEAGNSGDVFFALCLDSGDSERDRFWDHELGGPIVASVSEVGRDKCAQICAGFSASASSTATKRRARKRSARSVLDRAEMMMDNADVNDQMKEEEREEEAQAEEELANNDTKTFFGRHTTASTFRQQKQPKRSKRIGIGRSTAAAASVAPAVIYSWRTTNPTDMEAPIGECQCISVLQHIRLSFGSFAGFLV